MDGAFVINPSYAQRKVSALDIVVAGSKDSLVMVEAGAKEVGEDVIVQALEAGHAAIKSIVAVIDEMAAEIGKTKVPVAEKTIDPALVSAVESKMYGPLAEAMRIKDKLENYDQVDEVIAGYLSSFTEDEAEKKAAAKSVIKELKEKVLRDEMLDRGAAPRRPRVRRDPPDLDPGRRAAAHARLGGLHARRDAGAGHDARWAPPTISRRSRRWTARSTSASCCTTTSRRSRSAKWRSCAAPAAARSATARWPSARWRR